jgi:hypothetical protein
MHKETKFKLALAVVGALGLSGFDWPEQARDRGQRCELPKNGDFTFQEVARFDVANANQGVGVDERHFYAVDNTVITKHDKRSGREVGRWQWTGEGRNQAIHFDSAAVVEGRLYAAHSNYSEWPMTSSVEIFDTRTMKHIGSHSFGIAWGSMTWVDFHDGSFWGMFANYNAPKRHPDPEDPNGYDVLPGQERERTSINLPYGYKRATTLVKFNKDWQPLESWVMPPEVLTFEHTGDMSISGGSWGQDGSLYLTGHDPAEVHKVALPTLGSELVLVKTYALARTPNPTSIQDVSIRGQGIAWDRSACGELYGIIRATSSERAAGVSHKVTVSRIVR